MTSQTRSTLKLEFETGDRPDGSDYADLIDSFLSLSDTTAQTVTSPVAFSGAVSIAGGVSANAIEASTATITGTVSATHVRASSAAFLGSVIVSGGVAVQNAVSARQGRAIIVQRATIVGSNTTGSRISFSLPSGSSLLEFYVDVEMPFETAAGATAANVRLSAKNVANGNLAEVIVSASGRYCLTGAGGAGGYIGFANAVRNITATLEAWVSIVGSSTAMTSGQAMLSVVYV